MRAWARRFSLCLLSGICICSRFPAFLPFNRAVLTLKRRVFTPGLPHACPVPVMCLPRNGPPLSRCLGAQPCCPCLQKRRCLPLAPPVLPPSWQCAEPDSANGICSASLSCLRELFDGLISPSINVVNGGDQSYVRWFSTRAFEQFPFSLAVVGDIRREEQSLQR